MIYGINQCLMIGDNAYLELKSIGHAKKLSNNGFLRLDEIKVRILWTLGDGK